MREINRKADQYFTHFLNYTLPFELHFELCLGVLLLQYFLLPTPDSLNCYKRHKAS